MVKIILYTRDFEPITVIELPQWLLEQLNKHKVIKVAVTKPPGPEMTKQEFFTMPDQQTVTIYQEDIVWWNGTVHPVLVTDDEELALTLTTTWLPGQQATINTYSSAIRTLTYRLAKALRK